MTPKKKLHPLLVASIKGNISFIREYWKECGNDIFSVKSAGGNTIVHFASSFGNIDIVKFSLDSCRMLSLITNRDGKTGLHEASLSNHPDIVALFIEMGADVNSLKRGDWTPLMLACSRGNIEVVKCLVSYNADMKLQNKDGWTCLQVACRYGDVDVVSFLINTNPSLVNIFSHNERSCLHTACLSGKTEVVKILLSLSGLDIFLRDNCGSTFLHDAVRADNTHAVLLLLEREKNLLWCTDVLDYNILHICAEFGIIECAKCLVELILATREDSEGKSLSHLLKSSSKRGETPISLATLKHPELASYYSSLIQ